ncbi:MAG: methionine--tRNA ligase [Lautropia sp.]|nr:methionine--tRNA ligase [Lautropia sp.]
MTISRPGSDRTPSTGQARKRLFVTAALPYANGSFHIGHIMEYIQADIWVRFQRLLGHEVHFVCADDAHGAPIMLKADSEGIAPEELVARIAAERPRYLQGYHISFDHWHSTHSPENTRLSQEIYRKLKAKGLIETRTIEQFFDPVKAMFLPDRYIKGECPVCHAKDQFGDACEVCGSVYAPTDLINPYSTITGAAPVMRSSEHYFFKLSDPRCRDFLAQWTGGGRLQAEVANKAREWLGSDTAAEADEADPAADGAPADPQADTLADWDISRDAPYFGIPIPDAPGKFFYVWLDAPVGYLASLMAHCARVGLDFESFVAPGDGLTADGLAREQVHFIGKDIIYFHTLFWPAMLKFSDFKVPDHVFVHGFLTVSGEKMSKSRGTGLSPLKYLDLGMNPEWLRYYLAAKLNSRVEDVDFNADDFIARVNSDLVGKLVNIASRCAGFLTKRFDGTLAEADPATAQAFAGGWAGVDAISDLYQQRELGKAMREIMALADRVNQFIDSEKPWELAKRPDQSERLHRVCSDALRAFRDLALMLAPVLPATAAKVGAFLNQDGATWASLREPLPAGHRIRPYQHLLQRVDPKQVDALFAPPPDQESGPAAGPAKAAAGAGAAGAEGAGAKTATAAAATTAATAAGGAPSGMDSGTGIIGIDDFSKVQLRVARIVSAERVDGSSKLLKLMLDIGESQPRQVFSGIAAHYDPADLAGKLTVMVSNLAPRKMKFGLSAGMVLAAFGAEDEKGIFLLEPHAGASPGMVVR